VQQSDYQIWYHTSGTSLHYLVKHGDYHY